MLRASFDACCLPLYWRLCRLPFSARMVGILGIAFFLHEQMVGESVPVDLTRLWTLWTAPADLPTGVHNAWTAPADLPTNPKVRLLLFLQPTRMGGTGGRGSPLYRGEPHPYGRPGVGRSGTIRRITPAVNVQLYVLYTESPRSAFTDRSFDLSRWLLIDGRGQ